jgi:predicted nuclease of predicted toxin-antitoxin system
LEKPAAGESLDQGQSEHSRITAEGVRATIGFAAERCGQTSFIPSKKLVEWAPGIDDEAVLAKSRETDAMLITADKDFGDLVFRQGLIHSGILLLRLHGLEMESKAKLVSHVLAKHSDAIKLERRLLGRSECSANIDAQINIRHACRRAPGRASGDKQKGASESWKSSGG